MKLSEHFTIGKRSIRHCFELSKKYTLCTIINAFLSSVIVYIPIYFSAKVIDSLYTGAHISVIVKYVLLTVGLVFIIKLLDTYVASVKSYSAAELYISEDWKYSEKAMDMAYEYTEDPEITRLRARVRAENKTGFNLFYLYRSAEDFIGSTTKAAASIILTLPFFTLPFINIFIKLALILGVIVISAVSILSTSKMNKLDRIFMASSVDANVFGDEFGSYVNDYSSGKDIRLYGMKEFLADTDLKYNTDYYNIYTKNAYKRALWSIPGSILENIFKFGVYILLISASLAGGISVGSIAKYLTSIMLLISSLIAILSAVQRALDNNTYLKRYFSYFDMPNKMYKGSLTVEKRDDNEYDIEFRNVSFKYPNTDKYALKNINIKFKIGEKLAIVGMNGSGKTTFIKLLCRLYDPCEGEILLNGVNIQKYDYDEYMSIFSVVFQDFRLFPFKLGEIVASSKKFDKDKVTDCLVKANFAERLAELPEGADTYLYKSYDASGIEISGGEAQKIALARALYKDAPFILLDEPTAALDPISEYEVYSNFNAISGDKTAVYISHRLASCRFCDKIAVFDSGKIVQTGSHDMLLSDESGKYHELWHAQAQYYVSED